MQFTPILNLGLIEPDDPADFMQPQQDNMQKIDDFARLTREQLLQQGTASSILATRVSTAEQNINDINLTLTDLNGTAYSAQKTAFSAQAIATQAQAQAASAEGTANYALTLAGEGSTDAQNAMKTAMSAQALAASAHDLAYLATDESAQALGKAEDAEATAEDAKRTAMSAQTLAANAHNLAEYADGEIPIINSDLTNIFERLQNVEEDKATILSIFASNVPVAFDNADYFYMASFSGATLTNTISPSATILSACLDVRLKSNAYITIPVSIYINRAQPNKVSGVGFASTNFTLDYTDAVCNLYIYILA